MEILILPKENYPFGRVRLNQLFMVYFASVIDCVHWVAIGDGPVERKIGNNSFNLINPTLKSGRIGYLWKRITSIKKYWIAKKVIKSEKIDIIISNDGIIEGLIGLIIARKYGLRSAFYLSSFFLSMEVNELKMSPSFLTLLKVIKGLIKLPFYRFIIAKSDFFHPISDAMGKHFYKIAPKSRTLTLPLCPAKSFLDVKPSFQKIKNKFEIVYLGQITPVRRIDFLIDVARIIKDSTHQPFRIRLIGKTFRKTYKKKLLKKIIILDLKEEVELIDEIPFNMVPEIIIESNLGLSILPPILAYKISSPTKVVEYLSLGLPVVCNIEIEDQANLVRLSGGGLTSKYSIECVAGAIMELMVLKDELSEKGKRGREYILKFRTYERVAHDLKRFYEKSKKNAGG